MSDRDSIPPSVEECNDRPGACVGNIHDDDGPDAYEPTADELEAEYAAYLSRNGLRDVPCSECGAALLVQFDGPAVCAACERAAERQRQICPLPVSVSMAARGMYQGWVTVPGKRRPVSAGKYKVEECAWAAARKLARELAADAPAVA